MCECARKFQIKTCLILKELLTENFINIKHGLMTDVCLVNLDKCVLVLGTSTPVLFVEAQLLLCCSEGLQCPVELLFHGRNLH